MVIKSGFKSARNKSGGAKRKFSPKKKRWYVAASTPFGKFQAGSSAPKTKRALANFVRRVSSDQKLYVSLISKVGMTKDTFYTQNPLTISIGDGQAYRDSDTIFVKYIKYNLALKMDWSIAVTNFADITLRALVIEIPDEKTASSTALTATSGGGVDPANLLLNSSSATLSSIDKRYCKNVLCEKIFHITNPVKFTSAITTQLLNITCPINKKFIYRPGTTYGVVNNIYLVLMASSYPGTSGSSVIVSQVDGECLVGFTDSSG